MSLQITEGLVCEQVLQRDGADRASASLRGVCATQEVAKVLATVFSREVPLEGFETVVIGNAEGGAWSGRITGLPVGGPYVVQIQVGIESAEARGVYVGDLWVLAGQSNMEGCGDLADVELPAPYVHVLDMADRWRIAEEPLHWLIDSPDSCHCELSGDEQKRQQAEARKTRTKGAGLGLPFAKAMYAETGVPIGLLACAHGGTSMQQWNPDLKGAGGASLYGSMLGRVQRAGGKVAGVLWYQGESDANPTDAPLYTNRMKALVASIRADFKTPDLPFYLVQIGRVVFPKEWGDGDSRPWNSIQEQQRRLPNLIDGLGMVASADLELDDLIHIGTQGLKRLGERLARLALNESESVQLNSVSVEGDSRNRIRVSFIGASGEGFEENLRVLGFSIRNANGEEVSCIYKAHIDPDAPSDVLLDLTEPLGANLFLWHGWGFDPPCTLADYDDDAVPVFGPVALS